MERIHPDSADKSIEMATALEQEGEIEVPEQLQELVDKDLPTARIGVEAINQDGNTIWLTRSIARKPYKCPCCTEQIEIGFEHALMRVQSGTRHYDHHHLHKACSYTEIDYDSPVKIFKNNKKSDSRITKRQARSRARKSRKRRGKQ